MGSNVKLKEVYEVESKHGAFYTGGNVEWHENHLYCQTATAISKIDVETGSVTCAIAEDKSEEPDAIHTFTTDGIKTVTAHNSGLLKLWNANNECEKMWKYIHNGPIASLALKDGILLSGGCDGIVRVWELEHQRCTVALKGCKGVITITMFHPNLNLIFASGDDGAILCWKDREYIASYSGHYSKVNGIAFIYNDKNFVTSGRDQVIILWEIGNKTALKTIPVYEAVETIIPMPKEFNVLHYEASSGIHVAIAGERGVIRVWDVENCKEAFVQSNSLVSKASNEGGLAVTKLIKDKEEKSIAVITIDHNIIIHHIKSFAVLKQMIGFADEILDLIFLGENDDHLAVATNSDAIKLYENTTMNCQLLKGHTDIVLALNKAPFNPNLFASSGKDNSIRLWLLEQSLCSCVGIGTRHTASVGSLAFSTTKRFIVSVSQDMCLKMWNIPTPFVPNVSLNCDKTAHAHDKDINCVCVSPNNKIIATCSMDKTAKLWSDSLTLLGVLRGHRRGVWSVRFSPVDQVLMTSSADKTIKLWSLTELNCLKTIEGHEASIVRAEFLTHGMQILSIGADGLIKLFNLKTSECTNTFDEHSMRLWALAVNKAESCFVTGGSDSTLMKWKDVSEQKRQERIEEATRLALEDQQLSNYIQGDELLKALQLAIKLDKPMHVLKILQGIIRKGHGGLADTIKELRDDQKEVLLRYAGEWNTNSRNCHPAQLVLNVLINEIQEGAFKPTGLNAVLEGALPYTERHFKRATQMMQDLQIINYTINCMQPHAKIK